MTIDLSSITFTNDFFVQSLSDGGSLVLTNLDEEIVNSVGVERAVNRILITKVDENGENPVNYSNIIGLDINDIYVTSEYTDFLGTPLTKDNMAYCTLEIEGEE